jgi:hypothetical protein
MRFFFDENFSPRIVRAMGCLADADGDTTTPLRDRFGPSTSDEEYVSALCSEGDWIVATIDQHLVRKPHLLRAWQSAGLVVLYFLPGWSTAKFWEKAWRLAKRWPELREEAARARAGTLIVVPVSGALRRNG